PAGGSPVVRRFDWNSASGPLEAGVFLPGSVDGEVSVRASGMDGAAVVEATGSATVKPGKVSERLPLALRRASPLPDGGGPTPPDGGSAPADGPLPDGPAPADLGPPDTARPDAAPPDPPSLTRCTVYEHAGACTLTQSTAGVGVWDVRFSPDGQYVLTGGDDGKLKLWRVTPTGLVDDARTVSGGAANAGVHMAFNRGGSP